jgi:hypothetical protein
MRKTWTDLVIINGRARHSETQSHLIEHDDNQTLKMALEKWMQQHHHHRDSWSKGIKYMFMFIIFDHNFKKKYSFPIKVWVQLFMQLIPTLLLKKSQIKHLMNFFLRKTDLYQIILKYRNFSVNLV